MGMFWNTIKVMKQSYDETKPGRQEKSHSDFPERFLCPKCKSLLGIKSSDGWVFDAIEVDHIYRTVHCKNCRTTTHLPIYIDIS